MGAQAATRASPRARWRTFLGATRRAWAVPSRAKTAAMRIMLASRNCSIEIEEEAREVTGESLAMGAVCDNRRRITSRRKKLDQEFGTSTKQDLVSKDYGSGFYQV
eukprot:scaffold846_cov252-Pinguiococcus_pyrenoidosus.AAC.11